MEGLHIKQHMFLKTLMGVWPASLTPSTSASLITDESYLHCAHRSPRHLPLRPRSNRTGCPTDPPASLREAEGEGSLNLV